LSYKLDALRVPHPSFLLMYSALQFAPEEMAKPDGSLSLPYVAGALLKAGYPVKILDCSVGDDEDLLEDTFFRSRVLPSGLLRVGMPRERIAKKIADFDVIGLSSIFTTQTTMVLDLIRLAKEVDPNKLVIAGGVNSRNLRTRFFDAGADLIVLSEAETTIVQIAEALRGKRNLSDVEGIAFRDNCGKEVVNPMVTIINDLDQLPIPAWHLLPLDKYWDISRPHGGEFPEGKRLRYASLQTSRGCPFQCLYCHISKEEQGTPFGELGKYRMKSIGRVLEELSILASLGVEYVFFEDDSLFAKKKRAYELFQFVREMGLQLADVNGINLCHLQKNFGGTLGIDFEFIDVLAAAGFNFLTLPFESASQRLIDKYSTAKWNVKNTDIKSLLQALGKAGIKGAGNYMIGYPDETAGEVYNTVLMAKQHVEQGLNHALLFGVVPFPGSLLFDMVIRNGQLDSDFDTDHMKWTKSILKNLAIPAETLEHIRQLAWLTVNRSEFVNYKINMRVTSPESMVLAPSVPPTQLAIL
jgi:anaerobic magnesium-protoporphyrin IX monomethyl ester cyclase